MRLSSEMFPFASHEKYGYDLSFVDKELREIGDLAKKYGHRLTMHPGQVGSLARIPLTPSVYAAWYTERGGRSSLDPGARIPM
jgi:hypothetical protein